MARRSDLSTFLEELEPLAAPCRSHCLVNLDFGYNAVAQAAPETGNDTMLIT